MATPIRGRVRERPPGDIGRLGHAAGPRTDRAELLATVESDTEGGVERVEHEAQVSRGWLGPVAVVLVAVALIGFGLFGGAPTKSALPVPSVPDVTPVGPSPTPQPSTPETADLGPDPPIVASVAVDPGAIHSAILPPDTDRAILATTGSKVVFATTGGTLAVVDLAKRGPPQAIATVRTCHRIVDVAAAGPHVMWVEAWSLTATSEGACAVRKPMRTEWRIWLSDLRGAHRILLASDQTEIGGWGDGIEPSVATPRVAMTRTQYAFDVPATTSRGNATTVGVHDLRTRRRLWQVTTNGPIDHLELAADRVAYLQRHAILSVTTGDGRAPMFVAETDGTFSITADGRYLTWDENSKVFLADFHAPVPGIAMLAPDASEPGGGIGRAASPAAGGGPGGPIVFWRGTDAYGRTYLVVRAGAANPPLAVANAPSPAGGSVEGTMLIWRSLVPLPDGRTWEAVFALDLADVMPRQPGGEFVWPGGFRLHT